MDTAKTLDYLQTQHIPDRPERPTDYPWALQLIRLAFQTLGRLFPGSMARLAYRLFSTPRGRARHRSSDPWLEKARLFEFLYGKQVLKGYEWGSGEKVALLVHGWESRGTALRSFVPALLEEGYRVVAFDGPAHGDSAGKRTNIVHFGGAVRAILNHLGQVHSIICHSFGGASTVFALSNLPNGHQVENLVLIGVPSKMERVLNDALDTMGAPKAVRRKFVQFVERKVKFPIHHADTAKGDLNGKVGRILVVHDEEDHLVPFEEGQAIFEAQEGACMLVTKKLGHFKLMKNPDLIQYVARFLESG